ncbi:MAG: DUF4397 domain-containing protein [Bacteroidota bacterium]
MPWILRYLAHPRTYVLVFLALLTVVPGCTCATCDGFLYGGPPTPESVGPDGDIAVEYARYKECETLDNWWLSATSLFRPSQRVGAAGGEESATLGAPRVIGRVEPLTPDVDLITIPDGEGGLYIGGDFVDVLSPDGRGVQASSVAHWDASLNNGQGGWRSLGFGLNRVVRALALGPDGTLYAGGDFDTDFATQMPGVARWDEDAGAWASLGGGLVRGGTPEVQALAVDEEGRLVAAGIFNDAIDGDGASQSVNGIARWDPATDTWSAFGDGFQISRFTGLATASGGEVIAMGNLFLPDAQKSQPIVRWSGSDWSPYDQGIDAEGGTFEIVTDAEGTHYIRVFGYTDPDGTPNTGYRVARRGPDDAQWEVLASGFGFEGVTASRRQTGALLTGSFTEIDGQPTNGRARWDGASLAPESTPGTCSDLQLIHAIADPNALQVDLVYGDETVVPEFDFRNASPVLDLPSGDPADASIVLSGNPALRWARRALTRSGDDVLFTQPNLVFEDRACVAAPVGLLLPQLFAPNPDGLDTRASLASVDVPEADALVGGTAFLFLHAVSDAPAVDVIVDGVLQAEGVPYGSFAPPLILNPGLHEVTLVQSEDRETIGTYRVDLTMSGGERRTLAMTGFRDPVANLGGPSLTVALIDETGASVELPTAGDSGPVLRPEALRVLSVAPNPVRQSAAIRIAVPEPGVVRLVVHDARGREVAVVLDEARAAGVSEVRFVPEGLVPGVYSVLLTAGGEAHAQRFVLME